MAGSRALRKLQLGKEVVAAGTPVAATTIWRGQGVIKDNREVIFPEEDVPEEYEADTARNAAYFTDGPGYWDYDLEEERATYKGEAKD